MYFPVIAEKRHLPSPFFQENGKCYGNHSLFMKKNHQQEGKSNLKFLNESHTFSFLNNFWMFLAKMNFFLRAELSIS